MSLTNWAERECRLACKKENPDYDFDSNEFDYGCSCYKSALKAYNSLMEDGHSGSSFGFTKNILIKLMNGQPLTPITDDDFFSVERGTEAYPLESDKYLKERGLKSHYQCPRMSSLFREETLDGKISYHDVDRAYFVNIEDPSDTYSSWDGFLDDMFPITMPYIPERGKYKIYAQTFLADKNNGDFDTKGILYVITPSGEKVDIGIYLTEKDGKMVNITKDEYEKLLLKRVDKLNVKIANKLIWTLISNSASDKEISRREKLYGARSKELKERDIKELSKLCEFFCNPDNYKYNNFGMHQSLCKGEKEAYENVPELVEIAEYLDGILKSL